MCRIRHAFLPIGHYVRYLGRPSPADWRPFFYALMRLKCAPVESAIVLLSGGLDSMVCAGIAREQDYSVLALTVDYNQRHRVELEAAGRIAGLLADRHIVLPLDLRAFGGSALTG